MFQLGRFLSAGSFSLARCFGIWVDRHVEYSMIVE